MLRPGTEAPAFEAMLHTGEKFSLTATLGRQHLVLFFYPKDFTYGCTVEVCSFRDHFDELKASNTALLGVSSDTLEQHRDFASKHRLPFPLVADPGQVLAGKYDVVGLFGRRSQRVTYVIDRLGIIRGAFRHELLFKNHLRDTLQLLKSLDRESS